MDFSIYTLYALTYTAIALLVGLILFEDATWLDALMRTPLVRSPVHRLPIRGRAGP